MSQIIVPEKFKQFIGKHCETSALKRVMDYHGLYLSEEMLLGLGGGIGFIYWYMKSMSSPFIGCRNGKVTDFLVNVCRKIGAEVDIIETASPQKGYEALKELVNSGEPVIVYGDMAYLPYFVIPETAHFGGHAFVVFGLDEKKDEVYIYDRGKNPATVSINDLAKARGSKFSPFPPKHRILKIKYPDKIGNLEQGVEESIKECCHNMLEPPITNIGLSGMAKWAKIVATWPEQFKGINLLGALMNGFMYIEIAGTGGSAFRTMYAQFLEEANAIISKPSLKEVANLMLESAKIWSEIAAGLLSDTLPNLKAMRALMFEKNKLFEEQPQRALDKMMEINGQMDRLMVRAVEDLKKYPVFLVDVEKSIIRCYDIENRVFSKLNELIRQ